MGDCLRLDNPLLFFVQLSHCVINVAQTSQGLPAFMSFPLPPCSRNAGCCFLFCFVFFLSVFIWLHTVKSFSSLRTLHQFMNYRWFICMCGSCPLLPCLHCQIGIFNDMPEFPDFREYQCGGGGSHELIHYCSYSVELAWEAQFKSSFPSSFILLLRSI